jgi:hypothetical protein
MPEITNPKRKGLFWFIVWEVSVHDGVSPWLLACGDAIQHGGIHGRSMVNHGAHLMARKRRA